MTMRVTTITSSMESCRSTMSQTNFKSTMPKKGRSSTHFQPHLKSAKAKSTMTAYKSRPKVVQSRRTVTLLSSFSMEKRWTLGWQISSESTGCKVLTVPRVSWVQMTIQSPKRSTSSTLGRSPLLEKMGRVIMWQVQHRRLAWKTKRCPSLCIVKSWGKFLVVAKALVMTMMSRSRNSIFALTQELTSIR